MSIIDEVKKMRCKECEEERVILNNEGVCVFCSHPRKGVEVKESTVKRGKGITIREELKKISDNRTIIFQKTESF